MRMRVRWALKEVGQPYAVRLLSFAAMKQPAHPGLLPADPDARARAISWMFAASSTVEPPIVEREITTYLEGDKPWHAQRLPLIDQRIRARLNELAARLGPADWLDGDFSAGDL